MAYNRYYEYETSPRKIKPEYEPIPTKYPKKSTAKRVSRREREKKARAMQRKIIFYIAMCFTALFVISYRYSLIDDTFDTLKKEKANLAAINKENEQLEANIENTLNLTKIEEEAQNTLGMQKLKTEQIVYVSLPKADHIEASSEEIKSGEINENWFVKIMHKIAKSFK